MKSLTMKERLLFHWPAHLKQVLVKFGLTGTDSILASPLSFYYTKVHDQLLLSIFLMIIMVVPQLRQHLSSKLKTWLWLTQRSTTVLLKHSDRKRSKNCTKTLIWLKSSGLTSKFHFLSTPDITCQPPVLKMVVVTPAFYWMWAFTDCCSKKIHTTALILTHLACSTASTTTHVIVWYETHYEKHTKKTLSVC